IILVSDDGSNGTAAYRFSFQGSITLLPSQSVMLRYDATMSRWLVVQSVAAATTTIVGQVELATNAEAIAGTDTSRALTADSLTDAVT
ncbi:hypothetical protein, partial [Streptococcus pneumoniae]|uniref:hypothetical protein n=1 Tax=Streptococcus pneumoniae TaxID=1313 RepID=UPI001E4DCB34